VDYEGELSNNYKVRLEGSWTQETARAAYYAVYHAGVALGGEGDARAAFNASYTSERPLVILWGDNNNYIVGGEMQRVQWRWLLSGIIGGW
jgi:hypothetical protein